MPMRNRNAFKRPNYPVLTLAARGSSFATTNSGGGPPFAHRKNCRRVSVSHSMESTPSETRGASSAGRVLQIRDSPLAGISDKRVHLARQFAQNAHKQRTRKISGLPFFVHPVDVAETLAAADFATELIVAALLHDTVADTQTALAEIEGIFGGVMAGLVGSVTCPRLPNETWQEHRARSLASLNHAPDECLLLKCADALDNIRSIRTDLRSYGARVWIGLRSKEDFEWYYRSLGLLFARRLEGKKGEVLVRAFEEEFRAVFA